MFHTQGFWLRTLRLNPLKPFALPLLPGPSPTTTTTAGRMQAEKHRSALPCRLRSTGSAGLTLTAAAPT